MFTMKDQSNSGIYECRVTNGHVMISRSIMFTGKSWLVETILKMYVHIFILTELVSFLTYLRMAKYKSGIHYDK